jgi:formylglycine-generating enzyme required for sulfatase activity
VKLEMVLIPAGEFLMGDELEKPAHRVRITKPFYLGKYEVTQEQWRAVMGNNPSNSKGPKNPVEQVSWDDCQMFLKKLNADFARGKGRFALPTEAQWEYACRAGSTSDYCFGDDKSQFGDYAWYRANSGDTTHPVGEKRPNDWGLYDMHGNVGEWCADLYDKSYYAGSVTDDPMGPATGSDRGCRGGSFANDPGYCRSACRGGDCGPGDRAYGVGFRACLAPADKQGE